MTTAYDEMPYPTTAFRQTHPDRLAAHAMLFGLPCAPIDRCRVLEIAAGDGANIIPMALGLPGSRFVGFDLSGAAVGRGRTIIETLALGNIDLVEGDVLDFDPGSEPFDYVVAHGLYSWIPDGVRDALMALIERSLAPNGVAFVSYNALPGCRIRQALRDMLLFALREVDGLAARVNGARERLKVIVAEFDQTDAFNALIVHEATRLLERSPAVLAHDELSETYHPVHLHEFIDHAGRHGLQFLTEAEGSRCGEGFAPPYALDDPSFDVLDHAQDLDFKDARYFRQSLLVKADVPVSRRPAPERLLQMHASSPARRAESGRFVVNGMEFEVTDPRLAEVVERLGQAWPATLPIASLIDDEARAGAMLRMYWVGAVELHAAASTFPTTPSERPTASPLARLQASMGQTRLTTLQHGVVEVSDTFSLAFIAGLDGRKTRESIASALTELPNHRIDCGPEGVGFQIELIAKMALLIN